MGYLFQAETNGKDESHEFNLHECENEIFDLRSYTLVAVLFLLAFVEFMGMSRRSRYIHLPCRWRVA